MAKRIKMILLTILMIIPVLINASKYDTEVSKANSLLNKENYKNSYEKYIVNGSNIKFEYSNGTNKTNSSFTKGGFISLDEFKLTTVRGVSYLFDGVEYWTLTKSGSNVYAITYDDINTAKNASSNYGGRVTEFVNPSVTMSGEGKLNNPWTFDSVYNVNHNSSGKATFKVKLITGAVTQLTPSSTRPYDICGNDGSIDVTEQTVTLQAS